MKNFTVLVIAVFILSRINAMAAPADSVAFLSHNDTIQLDMGEPGITGEFASHGIIYIPESKEFYVQIGQTSDINATYIQITSPDKVNGNNSTTFYTKVYIPGDWGFKKIIGGKTYTNYLKVISYDSTKKVPLASNDTLCTNNKRFKLVTDSIKDAEKYIWEVLPSGAAYVMDSTYNTTLIPSPTYQGKITVRSVVDFGQYSGIITKVSNPLILDVVGGGPTSDFDAVTSGTSKVDFTNKSKNATTYTWVFGDGLTQNAVNADPLSHTYASKGKVTVALIARNSSKCPTDTLEKIVDVGKISLLSSDAVIELYPNPASDKIQVIYPKDGLYTPYTITNMSGVVVKSGIISSESSEIDITAFFAGAYILKVGDKNISFLKK